MLEGEDLPIDRAEPYLTDDRGRRRFSVLDAGRELAERALRREVLGAMNPFDDRSLGVSKAVHTGRKGRAAGLTPNRAT